MATENRKSVIFIIIGVAIILIAGAWLLFNFLSKAETQTNTNNDNAQAAKILKIKKLAQENLEFFPVNQTEANVLEELEKNQQYQGLSLDLNTSIDLENLGNPYPFASQQTEEEPQN